MLRSEATRGPGRQDVCGWVGTTLQRSCGRRKRLKEMREQGDGIRDVDRSVITNVAAVGAVEVQLHCA